MTLFEDTRQVPAQLDPDSQEHAEPEWVIAGFTDVAAELREDLQALKATRPDMVTAAR